MVEFMSNPCWNPMKKMVNIIKKMNFEQIVILAAGVLYFSAAVSYLLKRDFAWSLIWFAYATANFGLMIAGKKS